MRRAIRQRLVGDKAEKQKASTANVPATSSLQSTKVSPIVPNHDVQPQSSVQQEDPRPNLKHHQNDAQAGHSHPANGLEPRISIRKIAYNRLKTTKSGLLAGFETVVEEAAPSTARP